MSEETQPLNSETPNVVRSPKNTDRDLESENRGNATDGSEMVRDLMSFNLEVDDSPKKDKPIDLAKSAQTIEESEVVRKPVVIEDQAETDQGDRSPKNDRDFKA